MFLYLSNSLIQDSLLKGGNIPIKTSHSVIERPESVSLVPPPTKTREQRKINKTEDQISTGKLIFVFSKDILKKIDNFVHIKKLLMLYRSSYENAQ